MQRRLAAIMVADVVGSSRLIEVDEVSALSDIRQRWSEIVEPLVNEHSGRIFKYAGDGVLSEFASAVKAMECAVAIQERMAKANEGIDEGRQIVLRIGINVGDVIDDGSDILGDGVNVAARIEAFAEPGGICVSHHVQEAIRGKATVTLLDLGDQELKNIARPVRLWRTATNSAAKASLAPTRQIRSAPGQPSIAVLPFLNMSGDPLLWGIVGRKRAAQDDFEYSTAMRELGGTWEYENIAAFIADPPGVIPGTAMTFDGLDDDRDRADVVLYLRSLSDDPVPMP